jgi:membrane associated rhomboid family serine protease
VSPLRLMLVGTVLLLASCLVLLLMVIRVIAPSLLLSLAAYAASLGGLIVGIVGAVDYTRRARRESRG